MQRFKRLSGAWLLAALCSNAALAAAHADLEVGKSVAGQVDAAHSPTWQLALKAGDLVRGRVDGDVSLRLLDAEGRPVRLLIDGLDQPREFLFVAPQDGRYAVRAEPLSIRPAARFSLSLEQVLPVGEQRRTPHR